MAGIDAVHLVYPVLRGSGERSRAQNACRWYEQALGAETLHHTCHEASIDKGVEIHHVFQLRVGPPGSGVILEVRDACDNEDDNEEQNTVNILGYVSSSNVDVLLNRVLTTPVLGDADLVETTIEENGRFRVRDPFGFVWILASYHILPIQIQQMFHGNEPSIGEVSSVHLVCLVDHPMVLQACQWYRHVLGLVGVHGIPHYMRLGDGEQHTIVELQDVIPPMNQSDGNAFVSLYSVMPRPLHDRFMTGLGMDQATSLMINRHGSIFISHIRDPFGLHWSVKSTDPNLMI